MNITWPWGRHTLQQDARHQALVLLLLLSTPAMVLSTPLNKYGIEHLPTTEEDHQAYHPNHQASDATTDTERPHPEETYDTPIADPYATPLPEESSSRQNEGVTSEAPSPDAEDAQEPPAQGVVLQEPEMVYYPIVGQTFEALEQEMLRWGPVHYQSQTRRWAKTSWRLVPELVMKQTDTGCMLQRYRLILQGQIELPHWVNLEEGTAMQQDQWDRFTKALLTHESGHWQDGIDAAHALQQTIENSQNNNTCSAFKQNVEEHLQKQINAAHRRSLDYDLSTRYGETQGVRLQN